MDDPRMRDKLAESLSSHYGCEVAIMGYPAVSNPVNNTLIKYFPSIRFKRLSLSRLLQPLTLFLRILKHKPTHLIICTHELLVIGMLAKLMTRTKLLYDVSENYYQNIISLSAFPTFLRPFLAMYVRGMEVVSAPFVDLYILSDGCYQNQLGFIGKKFIIVENKVCRKNATPPDSYKAKLTPSTKLLFSGTLAESTGVFAAIAIAKSLHQHDSSVHLTIIGRCAQQDTLKKINDEIASHDFIQFIGGDQLVPHDLIMKHIHSSDFGIIAYPPNPAINDKYPTKLFEYLGAQLPIILTPNFLLESYCLPFQACVTLDPKSIDGQSLVSELHQKKFYIEIPGKEILWETEAEKLFNAFSNL